MAPGAPGAGRRHSFLEPVIDSFQLIIHGLHMRFNAGAGGGAAGGAAHALSRRPSGRGGSWTLGGLRPGLSVRRCTGKRGRPRLGPTVQLSGDPFRWRNGSAVGGVARPVSQSLGGGSNTRYTSRAFETKGGGDTLTPLPPAAKGGK